MARLSVLFSVLCSFAILAAFPASLASTTENPRGNAVHRTGPSKNTEDESDCPWSHVGHVEKAYQAGEEFTKDSSRFNEGPSEKVRRSRYSEGRREDDVSRSSHQRRPVVDLSSHDILPNPDLISASQAGKSTGDHGNPASPVKSTFGDDVERRSIDSLRRRGPDLQDDIAVAEDRYRPQYPYRYQQQYPNQRYRANDRRDPYRNNYLRYPVFPGR
ncbi:PREDICTED: uncharacterized protein LOC106742060 [Dinoponera quadriceps]|uniref:Uncharacterized protein LOC106742060 n=1 Tax=Dinoponera quadriceps TaxID=609295 RepID=A0A6P3WVM5_DINQU|nr:PREDICTED: uncharacterized protein LOC106742060 [Dinoponera quadriceps]